VRTWIGSIALAVASLLLCALVGEAVIRVLGASRTVNREGRKRFNVYLPNAKLNHTLRPDWEGRNITDAYDVGVRINELGFRGGSAKPQSAARPRILVVGDSFAFGMGVEDDQTFAHVMERELSASGISPEVLNSGVPAYAADQYLIFLRERGFDLAPDLILLSVCSNDTEELSWKSLLLGPDRLPVASRSKRHLITSKGTMRFANDMLLALPDIPVPGHDWLLDHSRLFSWARYRFLRAWIRSRSKAIETQRPSRRARPRPGPSTRSPSKRSTAAWRPVTDSACATTGS
jgi:hypothetical protein